MQTLCKFLLTVDDFMSLTTNEHIVLDHIMVLKDIQTVSVRILAQSLLAVQ